MSEYIFNPRETFLARCWWQGSRISVGPQTWADAQDRLAALWVESGSQGARGHWDRYLQSEKDGVLEKHLAPLDYPSSTQQYYELFWFGAYTKGSVSDEKTRYYDIRSADRVWTLSNWVLDGNASFLSGYVGIWAADAPAAALRKPQGSRLWTIDGLGRELKRGERQFNLQWVTPDGGELKRFSYYGDHFFNTRKGEAGLIAMEILSIPHHFEEI